MTNLSQNKLDKLVSGIWVFLMQALLHNLKCSRSTNSSTHKNLDRSGGLADRIFVVCGAKSTIGISNQFEENSNSPGRRDAAA
jgi:hypothetical protein